VISNGNKSYSVLIFSFSELLQSFWETFSFADYKVPVAQFFVFEKSRAQVSNSEKLCK